MTAVRDNSYAAGFSYGFGEIHDDPLPMMGDPDRTLAWAGRAWTDDSSPRTRRSQAMQASSNLFTGYGIGRVPEVIVWVQHVEEATPETLVRVEPKETHRLRFRVRSVTQSQPRPAVADFEEVDR